MFYSTLLLAATALTGLVSAQNYSTSGPLSIVPDSVPLDLRESWCTGQHNTCGALCDGTAVPNNCSATTLEYDCTCVSGNTPNISNYMDTIPFYVCQQWVIDCTAAHPNDLAGQTACQAVKCGTLNASADATTTTTTSAASSASSTSAASSASGSGSSSASATTSAASASSTAKSDAVLSVGMNYGLYMLGAGLLAAFGLAL